MRISDSMAAELQTRLQSNPKPSKKTARDACLDLLEDREVMLRYISGLEELFINYETGHMSGGNIEKELQRVANDTGFRN